MHALWVNRIEIKNSAQQGSWAEITKGGKELRTGECVDSSNGPGITGSPLKYLV